MDARQLAAQLRRVREAKGLTQKQVAQRLNLKDTRQVRALESPASNPTLGSPSAYARVVGADIKWEVRRMRVVTFINHVGGASKASPATSAVYSAAWASGSCSST